MLCADTELDTRLLPPTRAHMVFASAEGGREVAGSEVGLPPSLRALCSWTKSIWQAKSNKNHWSASQLLVLTERGTVVALFCAELLDTIFRISSVSPVLEQDPDLRKS